MDLVVCNWNAELKCTKAMHWKFLVCLFLFFFFFFCSEEEEEEVIVVHSFW